MVMILRRRCCNFHDVCFSTCGTSFEWCEKQFEQCMTRVCKKPDSGKKKEFGGGDDTLGNPPRAQVFKFEHFELFSLLKLDKFPVEQFEATVSQSTASSPLLQECRGQAKSFSGLTGAFGGGFHSVLLL